MATRVTVDLDAQALDAELRSRTGAPARVLAGLASHATTTARELAQQRITSRTGRYLRGLRSSISNGPNGPRLEMVADADHSVFIEFGTRPHQMPKRSAAQGPYAPGRVVLWRYTGRRGAFSMGPVSHPGTRAQHILTDTFDSLARVFDRIAAANADPD